MIYITAAQFSHTIHWGVSGVSSARRTCLYVLPERLPQRCILQSDDVLIVGVELKVAIMWGVEGYTHHLVVTYCSFITRTTPGSGF